MIKRKYFKAEVLGPDYFGDEREEAVEAEANLISSLGEREFYDIEDKAMFGNVHYPVLDLDFPCTLLPSSSPGKFHLYMDRGVTWLQYQNVLAAMAGAGLLEAGYVSASIARRATFVRKPGVIKLVK